MPSLNLKYTPRATLASYLSVPPSTLVNQCLPICSSFLAAFQNLNSSIEADNLPDPSASSKAPKPSGDSLSPPRLAIIVPVTCPTAPEPVIPVSIQDPLTNKSTVGVLVEVLNLKEKFLQLLSDIVI